MKELDITYKGFVYPWYCDHMGHMNVMWYTGKFDEATWNFLSLLGLTAIYFKQQSKGMVASEHQTFYKQELRAGMSVYIKSGIIELSDKAIKIFHEMRNCETNKIVAITYLTGVHIDSIERKACSIPDTIKNTVKNFIKTDDTNYKK